MDGYFFYEAPCFDDDEVVITPEGLTTEGALAKQKAHGNRVTVPSFQIYQNPTIKLSEVKSRRFDVIDRAVQKARAEIMKQEDDRIFQALDGIFSGNKDI